MHYLYKNIDISAPPSSHASSSSYFFPPPPPPPWPAGRPETKTLFMFVEGTLVTLLILPMPSNDIRRKVTDFVSGLWESKPVQYFSIGFLILDSIYFYFIMGALLHPLYDLGILSPIDMSPTCEIRQAMFREERNAFISGMGLFLFFVLNRLVDIQDKLHRSRHEAKEAAVRTRETKKDD